MNEQVKYKVSQCNCGYKSLSIEQLPAVPAPGLRRELKRLARDMKVNFHPEPFVKCPRCKVAPNPLANVQPNTFEIDTNSPEHLQQHQRACEAMSKILE